MKIAVVKSLAIFKAKFVKVFSSAGKLISKVWVFAFELSKKLLVCLVVVWQMFVVVGVVVGACVLIGCVVVCVFGMWDLVCVC